MTADVNGRRSRGGQKKGWGDIIQQDMKSIWLKKDTLLIERSGEEGSEWLTPPREGSIQPGRKKNMLHFNMPKLHYCIRSSINTNKTYIWIAKYIAF